MDYQAPRGAIWAAELFEFGINIVGKVVDMTTKLFHELGSEVKPLDRCKTAEDVIAYANSIRYKDPTFASELFEAAGRAEK